MNWRAQQQSPQPPAANLPATSSRPASAFDMRWLSHFTLETAVPEGPPHTGEPCCHALSPQETSFLLPLPIPGAASKLLGGQLGGLVGNAKSWRKQHNYFLDRGMKFNIAYRSPAITGTDLFDLEKFGCHQSRGWQGFKLIRRLLKQKHTFKKWWRHPSFSFDAEFETIGVRLQDLTTGELKWDAVYSVGKAPHKEPSTECKDDLGTGLCPEEKPIGGSKPFFQPDWCPAPGDALAHKYRLAIANLSMRRQPGRPLVGEILFTQYGPKQLADTYAFENAAKG